MMSDAPRPQTDNFLRKLEHDALLNSRNLEDTVNDGSPRNSYLPKSSLPVRNKKHILEGYETVIFGHGAKETRHSEGKGESGLEVKEGAELEGAKVKTKSVELPFRPSAEYRNFVKEQCQVTNRFGAPASKLQRGSEVPTSYNSFLKRRTEYVKPEVTDPSAHIIRCSDDLRVNVSIGQRVRPCPSIEAVRVHIDLVNRVMGKEEKGGVRKIKCGSERGKIVRHRPQDDSMSRVEGSQLDIELGKEKCS